jgi:hypothetical protein
MWFEWTQDDRLSKIGKDVKDVQRKKCITLDGKVVVNVKTIIVKVNVVDANVLLEGRSQTSRCWVFQWYNVHKKESQFDNFVYNTILCAFQNIWKRFCDIIVQLKVNNILNFCYVVKLMHI